MPDGRRATARRTELAGAGVAATTAGVISPVVTVRELDRTGDEPAVQIEVVVMVVVVNRRAVSEGGEEGADSGLGANAEYSEHHQRAGVEAIVC